MHSKVFMDLPGGSCILSVLKTPNCLSGDKGSCVWNDGRKEGANSRKGGSPKSS